MRKVFYKKFYPYPIAARQRRFYEARGIGPGINARQAVAKRVEYCVTAVSEMTHEMVRSIARSPFTPKGGR